MPILAVSALVLVSACGNRSHRGDYGRRAYRAPVTPAYVPSRGPDYQPRAYVPPVRAYDYGGRPYTR